MDRAIACEQTLRGGGGWGRRKKKGELAHRVPI